MRILFKLILVCALISCTSGCPKDSEQPEQAYQYSVPNDLADGLVTGSLVEQSIDQELIEAMFEAITAEKFTGIDSVLIIRNGVLVLDELLRDELGDHDRFIGNEDLNVHSMQSVSKSFASAVVGIAIDQGYIGSEEDLILNYFPEYSNLENDDARKHNWTVKDFLTMQTGLQWDEWSAPFSSPDNSLSSIYNSSNDYVKALFNLPMDNQPGSTFAYSTVASVALGALVENATGMSFEQYADANLFQPLQMNSFIWGTTPVGRAHTGGGLWLSSRDMIKFGQLFLQRGQWQGQTIISPEWVERSTSQQVLLSQYSNWHGYAYQWWVDNFQDNSGQLQGIYSANGNGGQFIFIWPEKNAVIVFTGQNYDSQSLYQPQQMMREYIIPAIL